MEPDAAAAALPRSTPRGGADLSVPIQIDGINKRGRLLLVLVCQHT